MLELLLIGLVSQAPAPKPCSAPEHRQFDFWIGEWIVRDPKGRQLGTNRIEAIENGCGLQENWRATNGSTGRSINAYHELRRTWVQHWVGAGSILLIEGKYEDGKMVLAGSSPGQNGAEVRDRITWSRLDGGRLRQLWEQSGDGGTTWTVVFDGTYSSATK